MTPTPETEKASTESRVEPVRVLVVDDHELVRYGLFTLLDAQPDIEVVATADTAAECLRLAVYENPDVVVLDLNLPDGSGIQTCARLRTAVPPVHVLILTAFADHRAVREARAAGARGYLIKRIHNSHLVDAIRTVADGGLAFDASAEREPADPILSHLTPRETEILALIAEGMTNREIAERLYLAEKTVKNYVSNLLAKMGLHHRSGAAAYFVERSHARLSRETPADW